MEITFSLPHVFYPNASRTENALVLQALLKALVDINVAYIKLHPDTPLLYNTPVYYRRTYWWEPIPALYNRGFGDCKSLTAAIIAERKVRGIPAQSVFRWAVNPETGGRDFHILVQTPTGYEDPSKVKGMGANEVAKYR